MSLKPVSEISFYTIDKNFNGVQYILYIGFPDESHTPSSVDPKHGDVDIDWLARKFFSQGGKFYEWWNQMKEQYAMPIIHRLKVKTERDLELRRLGLTKKANIEKIIKELRKKKRYESSDKNKFSLFESRMKLGMKAGSAMEIASFISANNVKTLNAQIKDYKKLLERRPYNLYAEMQKAGREIIEKLQNAIIGGAQPADKAQTRYNRKWRGNRETPPLNETGEFARSITYEIKKVAV